MDSFVEIPSLNLDGAMSGGNGSFSNDPASNNAAAVVSASSGTKDEKNLIRYGDIDYKSQMKRHTERENEISIGDQVRGEMIESPLKNSRQRFTQLRREPVGREYARKRHLAEEIGNESYVSSATEIERSPQKAEALRNGPSHYLSNEISYYGHQKENQWDSNTVEGLKRQNRQLLEVSLVLRKEEQDLDTVERCREQFRRVCWLRIALLKTEKNHATEKKRFHEILFGIDKALSSLPIRLEKIRVRNQKNLSIINSSRFFLGNGSDNPPEPSAKESTFCNGSETGTSQDDSQFYMSNRMKCLLRKMDQLNDLIHTIKEGESSPIEMLVNSELYAISLLKKEIRSTKKQIEDNGTDSETVTSCEGSHKVAGDSSSKAKNSFSNELNKASNFKIFENHMILQEEALNLLTRKIKETEAALLKEVEAKEGLKRENEAMAKEIFRLKSMEEETKGEKCEKMEKLKAEAEATGNRPYRLIKELKTKLEEKEKSLIAWKSKCSRLEAVGANKTVLIENERKKNFELETTVKNLKSQNKSKSSHLNSLQFLNEQLRDQIEILRHQVEILAKGRLELELNSATTKSEIGGHITELSAVLKNQEEKKVEKDDGNKLKELKINHEKELEETKFHLVKSQNKNDEFSEAFKELLISIHSYAVEKEVKSFSHPSHSRIREILNITSSDLQLLYSVYIKSINEKEVEKLYDEFRSIVDGEDQFSETLSTWFFDLLKEKLLPQSLSETD